MLMLTRKTDYALIALTHLYRQQGQVASAREIADEYRIPLNLLMNILKHLTKQQVISSVRGARGGYKLSVDPEQFTLSDMISAVEGPVALTPCIAGRNNRQQTPCRRESVCPICQPIELVQNKLEQLLAQTTLADICEHTTDPTADQSYNSRDNGGNGSNQHSGHAHAQDNLTRRATADIS